MVERIPPELYTLELPEFHIPEDCRECPILELEIEKLTEVIDDYNTDAETIKLRKLENFLIRAESRRNPDLSTEEVVTRVKCILYNRTTEARERSKSIGRQGVALQHSLNEVTDVCPGIGQVYSNNPVMMQRGRRLLEFCQSRKIPDGIAPVRVMRELDTDSFDDTDNEQI